MQQFHKVLSSTCRIYVILDVLCSDFKYLEYCGFNQNEKIQHVRMKNDQRSSSSLSANSENSFISKYDDFSTFNKTFELF